MSNVIRRHEAANRGDRKAAAVLLPLVYDELRTLAAEPMLLAGYEGMNEREKAIPPQAKIRLPEALDRLIELDSATNRPDDLLGRPGDGVQPAWSS